jgi:hypothetical protein
LELYEKLYVKPSFLDSDHGLIPCEDCHGGAPDDPDWLTAHDGVVKDPTFPDPEPVCGKCHEEIAASAANSLHYSLALFLPPLQRAPPLTGRQPCRPSTRPNHGTAVPATPAVANATSAVPHMWAADCWPAIIWSGLPWKRSAPPAMAVEYSPNIPASTWTTLRMFISARRKWVAWKCHRAAEMHADGSGAADRFQAPHRPSCRGCHEQALCPDGENRFHTQHAGDLSCQVCHALAYKNCFSCHVGTDDKGLAYFKCRKTRMGFKIGHNPRPSAQRPQNFVVLRHAPATPTLFDAYTADALPRFDRLPTWKPSTPHTIQRHTPRNSSCRACHGHAGIFLGPSDMEAWERKANGGVIVSPDRLPKPLKEVQ